MDTDSYIHKKQEEEEKKNIRKGVLEGKYSGRGREVEEAEALEKRRRKKEGKGERGAYRGEGQGKENGEKRTFRGEELKERVQEGTPFVCWADAS